MADPCNSDFPNAECHIWAINAEFHYAECYYDECRGARKDTANDNTQYNVTQHNDNQHNVTQHNDNQSYKTLLNVI